MATQTVRKNCASTKPLSFSCYCTSWCHCELSHNRPARLCLPGPLTCVGTSFSCIFSMPCWIQSLRFLTVVSTMPQTRSWFCSSEILNQRSAYFHFVGPRSKPCRFNDLKTCAKVQWLPNRRNALQMFFDTPADYQARLPACWSYVRCLFAGSLSWSGR